MFSGGLRYSSASSPFYALLVRRCPFYAVEDFEHAQNLERTRNVQNFSYECVPSPEGMRSIRLHMRFVFLSRTCGYNTLQKEVIRGTCSCASEHGVVLLTLIG